MSELNNGYVTPEKLFSAENFSRRFLDLETEAGTFRIRSLNDREYQKITSVAIGKNGLDKIGTQQMNARWIIACAVDAEGNQVFTDHDLNKIRDLDAGLVSKLSAVCREHSRAEEVGN